jgi:cephalosporin hydroxylase
MNPHETFLAEVEENIDGLGKDQDLQALSRIWVREISRHNWPYNFSWLGRPAIQFPTDAWAMQEIIWATRPDLIIETGIAHGGSLIFYASMLALIEMTEALEQGTPFDPRAPRQRVLGIDIDIREHNRQAIEAHPMANRIQMLQGSSISPETIDEVRDIADKHQRILVCLDSNHTADHVLAELEAYAPLVSPGSYCVVFDTLVDDMPEDLIGDRPWGPENNPKVAVRRFLAEHSGFEIDRRIQHKLLLTVAPDGYLKRVA